MPEQEKEGEKEPKSPKGTQDEEDGKAGDDGAGAPAEGEVEESEEEKDSKLPFHKHPRWQEVYKEAKDAREYKGLGTPTDLQGKLQKLDRLERLLETAEAERETDEPLTDDEKKLQAQYKKAYKELLQIAPEIAEIKQTQGALGVYFKSLERRAENETRKVMSEAGLPTTAKDLGDMAEILVRIIQTDEDLYMEYVGDPRSAVREAFTRFKRQFSAAAKRSAAASLQKDKEPLKKVPKPHGPGGGAGTRADDKGPRNIKEADARVRERLKNIEF